VASLLVTALAGVLFGLALAAPPGPMNAVIAEESVLRGWSAGFLAGLGAMVADVCFLVAAAVGAVAVVAEYPTLRAGMVGVGGLLMLYFAYGAAADAAGGFTGESDAGGEGEASGPGNAGDAESGAESGERRADDESATVDAADRRGFRKAFALALTNPYQVLFWLTVGVGLLEPGELDALARTPYVGEALAGLVVVETGSPALLAGLFGGIAVWIVGFPATLVSVGRRVERFSTAVAYLSALALAGFGVVFLGDAVDTLL
jgi:threonine/homoserine/homoserine lactone efflux protein